MPRYHDITLPITEEITTYPGDPEVRFHPHYRIAAGDPCNVTALSLGTHTGTHVDAPRHFVEHGRAVDELALDHLIGPATVLELPSDVRAIGPNELHAFGLDAGARRVLLKTGSLARLEAGAFADQAYLTGAAARLLVRSGVRLVGIDALSVDPVDAERWPAHEILLRAGVVILEGVDLRQVPAGEYELICLPLRFTGLDGSPVRAVLRTLES